MPAGWPWPAQCYAKEKEKEKKENEEEEEEEGKKGASTLVAGGGNERFLPGVSLHAGSGVREVT